MEKGHRIREHIWRLNTETKEKSRVQNQKNYTLYMIVIPLEIKE